MSRSKRGSKPPGHDYWGRRGIRDKETTKGTERMKERADLAKVARVVKED